MLIPTVTALNHLPSAHPAATADLGLALALAPIAVERVLRPRPERKAPA